jgi:hypothetical protein
MFRSRELLSPECTLRTTLYDLTVTPDFRFVIAPAAYSDRARVLCVKIVHHTRYEAQHAQ